MGAGGGEGAAGGAAAARPRSRARKYAVRFGPPAEFILDYEEEPFPGRRRLRVVKLKDVLERGQGARYIARKVIQAFPRRLDRAALRPAQVERLVQRLLDALSGAAGGALPPGGTLEEEADLNKLSTEELDGEKARMEVLFQANRVERGDEGYEYDVQKDFGPPTEDNDWDSSSDEDV